MTSVQVTLDNWFVRNVYSLKTSSRIIFGFIWAIDASLKFMPGLAGNLVDMIKQVAQGQPSWLKPWFDYWSATVSSNPQFYVTMTGIGELALAFALVLGLLRKEAYTFGFFLSLFIWSVPEGFRGPYGSGSTDIGTGIVYALVFVFLLLINATFGPSRYSLDYAIERRWKWWRRVAEVMSA